MYSQVYLVFIRFKRHCSFKILLLYYDRPWKNVHTGLWLRVKLIHLFTSAPPSYLVRPLTFLVTHRWVDSRSGVMYTCTNNLEDRSIFIKAFDIWDWLEQKWRMNTLRLSTFRVVRLMTVGILFQTRLDRLQGESIEKWNFFGCPSVPNDRFFGGTWNW